MKKTEWEKLDMTEKEYDKEYGLLKKLSQPELIARYEEEIESHQYRIEGIASRKDNEPKQSSVDALRSLINFKKERIKEMQAMRK